MRKSLILCILLLCVMFVPIGSGCSSHNETAEETDSDNVMQSETAESSRQTVVIKKITENSIEVEHIILLNSYLEEDMKILEEMNIPEEEYQYGYYRKDSGEIHTYNVDQNSPVTIYDISQQYSESEDRLHTFKTYQDFFTAVQTDNGLLKSPYILTLQEGIVTRIEEKFYN